MTLLVALALAGRRSGNRRARVGEEEDGEHLIAIIHAHGNLGNLENHSLTLTEQNGTGLSNVSSPAKQNKTAHLLLQNLSDSSLSKDGVQRLSTKMPMTITPIEQNDTGHLLVQELPHLSVSTVSVPQSRSNMSMTSSFIEYGKGVLSFWMSHREGNSHRGFDTVPLLLAIAVWSSTLLAILLCCLCCYFFRIVPREDLAWPKQFEQYEPYSYQQQPEPEDMDDKPEQTEPKRSGPMAWVQSRVHALIDDESTAGDKESAHDRVAKIISENHRTGRSRHGTPQRADRAMQL